METTITLSNGAVYKRVAWMGGSSIDRGILAQRGELYKLVLFFLHEQINIFVTAWGDCPDLDTMAIFLNRAEGDAWSTYREKHNLE